MKKFILGTLLLINHIFTNAQTILSDQAEISVITCGPGQEAVFTAFGHSAFRVYDPVNGIDHAYNYGVFDFDQPNFYLNFARGYNQYKLAVQDYRRFEYYYIYYNRYVHEQVLNLDTEQKQKLFNFLAWNALPENQFYLYDYFYDNCATKIPEVVSKVFGDQVKFDGSHITTNYSIRQLTDMYLKYQPWGDLGIDLCLGLPMDKKASAYEYMFLPDFVELGFDNAYINGNPLVKEKYIIHEAEPEVYPFNWLHPALIFSALLIITLFISWLDQKRKRINKWFDSVMLIVVGAVGLLLLLLWVATDHKAAAWNFNLLWAVPSHLVYAFLLWKKEAKLIKSYYGFNAILIVLMLVSWPVLPQALNASIIPLLLLLFVRFASGFQLLRKEH